MYRAMKLAKMDVRLVRLRARELGSARMARCRRAALLWLFAPEGKDEKRAGLTRAMVARGERLAVGCRGCRCVQTQNPKLRRWQSTSMEDAVRKGKMRASNAAARGFVMAADVFGSGVVVMALVQGPPAMPVGSQSALCALFLGPGRHGNSLLGPALRGAAH